MDSPVDNHGILNVKRVSMMSGSKSEYILSGGMLECMSGIDITLSTNNCRDTYGMVRAQESVSNQMLMSHSNLTTNNSFWVRFFWLSGCLSILSGDKVKAYEEFCVSLVLLRKNKVVDGPSSSVVRPHCKFTRELTVDRVLHEIYLL